MAGALNEIGWIDEVTVNKNTGRIVDGHLRVTLALRAGDKTPVPYKEVDLSEEEEALALATKDPIAALAVTDNAQYLALLEGVTSGEAALQTLLDQVAVAVAGARQSTTRPTHRRSRTARPGTHPIRQRR
jgi:ParB-like chromosome segregation protein Spo0J